MPGHFLLLLAAAAVPTNADFGVRFASPSEQPEASSQNIVPSLLDISLILDSATNGPHEFPGEEEIRTNLSPLSEREEDLSFNRVSVLDKDKSIPDNQAVNQFGFPHHDLIKATASSDPSPQVIYVQDLSLGFVPYVSAFDLIQVLLTEYRDTFPDTVFQFATFMDGLFCRDQDYPYWCYNKQVEWTTNVNTVFNSIGAQQFSGWTGERDGTLDALYRAAIFAHLPNPSTRHTPALLLFATDGHLQYDPSLVEGGEVNWTLQDYSCNNATGPKLSLKQIAAPFKSQFILPIIITGTSELNFWYSFINEVGAGQVITIPADIDDSRSAQVSSALISEALYNVTIGLNSYLPYQVIDDQEEKEMWSSSSWQKKMEDRIRLSPGPLPDPLPICGATTTTSTTSTSKPRKTQEIRTSLTGLPEIGTVEAEIRESSRTSSDLESTTTIKLEPHTHVHESTTSIKLEPHTHVHESTTSIKLESHTHVHESTTHIMLDRLVDPANQAPKSRIEWATNDSRFEALAESPLDAPIAAVTQLAENEEETQQSSSSPPRVQFATKPVAEDNKTGAILAISGAAVGGVVLAGGVTGAMYQRMHKNCDFEGNELLAGEDELERGSEIREVPVTPPTSAQGNRSDARGVTDSVRRQREEQQLLDTWFA